MRKPWVRRGWGENLQELQMVGGGNLLYREQYPFQYLRNLENLVLNVSLCRHYVVRNWILWGSNRGNDTNDTC